MNTKQLTALLFVAMLINVETATAEDEECATMTSLRLIVDDYHLRLNSKKPICVTSPGTVRIRVRPRLLSGYVIPPNSVRVEQKEGSPLTIEGNNADDAGKIKVSIGHGGTKNTNFDFLITVDGIGVLDPKVRVVGEQFLELHKKSELLDTLDALDLTLEQATNLLMRAAETE